MSRNCSRPSRRVASPEDVRIAEAMVFASAEPLEESSIAARLSDGADVAAVMEELRRLYAGRGVNLVRVAPALDVPDRARPLLAARARRGGKAQAFARRDRDARHRRLSSAGDPRGHRGDPRRRRVERGPGRLDGGGLGAHAQADARRRAAPITYGTTTEFLIQFGLDAIGDLPGLDELQARRLVRWQVAGGLRRSSARATSPR